MKATLLSDHRRPAETRLAKPARERRASAGRSLPIRTDRFAHSRQDNPVACGMILHKFAARSDDQMAALARALEAGNAPELARGARTLGSVAADLSADTLCALAAELQRWAERGELDEAAAALVRTRDEIDRCVEVAGELLDQLLADDSSGAAS